MKLLRFVLYCLALAALLFFVLRLGSLLKKPVLTLDRTQVLLEKVRRIQKVNLASSFSSRITPDDRADLQVASSGFFFKYVALIRVDVFVDYSRAVYDAAGKKLRLPALEFEANVVPGASFLWKAEGDLSGQPTLERRFTQSEEEIMRGEVLEVARHAGSALRQKSYESCRNFFLRLDPGLIVEFNDEI